MMWGIFTILIAVSYRRFLVASQPRNVQFGYQGMTKLASVGSKLTIECPLKAQFYFWRLYQPNSDSRVLLDQDLKTINIESATADKSGIYECKSTTGFGNAVTNITIKIIDPHSEISKEICSFKKTENVADISDGLCFLNDDYQKTTRYKLGTNTEFDCEAAGNNLRYYWKFIDQNGSQRKFSTNQNITKLIVTHIIPENEGTYRCDVMNDKSLKIYRSFSITIADISSESGIEIMGEKYISYSLKYGENVSLICDIKNSYQRIHSVKWGKRIEDPMLETKSTSNIVFWDNHNYRVLPTTGNTDSNKNTNQITSTRTLTLVKETSSGIYICLAMNTFGGTTYKLFNLTVSADMFADNSGKRSQFFFLYILSPAILIFICICAIVYCCVKSSSAKSSNSVPLKQYNSSTPSNGNKTTTSNYYYPVTTSRAATNCPPLPLSSEAQASLVSQNTAPSYNGYGNYHFTPSNQQSCCSTNGV